MKLTSLVVLAALGLGTVAGVAIGSADAEPTRPMQVSGGPLVPVGVSGTGAAWVLEPNSRTIYVCASAPSPACAKTALP